MSKRISGWSSSDAAYWLDYYWDEDYYGELIPMSAWEWNGNIYKSSAWFTIGGWDSYGRDDSVDIAPIYLEGGKTYEVYVSGELEYSIESDLTLLIFDDWGYPLEVHYFLRDPLVDRSLSFTPSYDGWYHISTGTDSYNYYTTLLYVAEIVPIPVDIEPFLIPDSDSYDWNNDIDDGSGYWIASNNAMLYRAYMGAMGRLPDWGGFSWWLNEMQSGREDLYSMADGFVSSAEFKGYADTNYNGYIDNHEFVTHMYEGVFGRAPDQGGYDYWIGELNSGVSDQGEVLIYMTQSNEYIDQTLETVADYLFT